MKTIIQSLSLFLLFFLCLASPSQATANTSLLQHSIWDDGKAEFNIYEGEEIIYGIARKTSTRHIIVKELFNLKLGVKADSSSPNSIEVIKLNKIISSPTGTYRYERMHSSFWERQSTRLLKFSLSHHDACGNTFKMGRLTPEQLTFTYHTYWDREGDGQKKIDLPQNALFYEELPIRLRLLVADHFKGSKEVFLFYPLIHSKLGKTEFTKATLTADSPQKDKQTLRLKSKLGTDTLTFSSTFPHVLLSWKRSNGSFITLKKTMRLDYWNKNRPEDKKLLE